MCTHFAADLLPFCIRLTMVTKSTWCFVRWPVRQSNGLISMLNWMELIVCSLYLSVCVYFECQLHRILRYKYTHIYIFFFHFNKKLTQIMCQFEYISHWNGIVDRRCVLVSNFYIWHFGFIYVLMKKVYALCRVLFLIFFFFAVT